MEWADAIEQYVSAKVKWSDGWKKNVAGELFLLARWAVQQKQPIEAHDLRRRHALAFLGDRKAGGVSQNTIRRAGEVIAGFTSFWTLEGVYKTDPLGALFKSELPKKEKPHVRQPSKDALSKLLCAIREKHAPHANPHYHQSKNSRSFLKSRDTAIVLLMVETGMRPSEVCQLKLEAVQLDRTAVVDGKECPRPIITVTVAKSKKPRYIPISCYLASALRSYLFVRDRQLFEDFDLFFPTVYCTQMTRDSLHKQIDRYWEFAGVAPVTLYSLRHVSLKYLTRGGSIKSAQKVAGHADIRTTAGYGEMDEEEVYEDVERAATLSRLFPIEQAVVRERVTRKKRVP